MSETELLDRYSADEGLTVSGWSQALRDGILLGQSCEACGHVTAAPKAACARCGARGLELTRLPTSGEVYSETRIEVAPEGFEAPYTVGLVSLGQARVLARLPAEAAIGDSVALAGVVAGGATPAPRFE